ncbi:MAG: DNA alkylation repair protein [Solirubrobacterales bacterium]
MTSRAARLLEAALRAGGDPERAAGSKRYLKSELEHLGVRVPEVRRLACATAAEAGSRAELDALVDRLWARPVFECRLAAAMALEARPDLVTAAELARIRRMVHEAGTWAIVDVLAVKVLGALLTARPEAAPRLDGWARDGDFWVRRAALLSQIEPLKAGAPFDRFAAYAEAMLEEREFFIRKAIGWVLREAAKTRGEEVYAWLAPRASRASGVTMREAVKYLPPARRERLLAATRDARDGRGRPGEQGTRPARRRARSSARGRG